MDESKRKPLIETFSNFFNINIKPDKDLINRVQGLSNIIVPNDVNTSTAIPIDIETYNILSELLGTPDQRIAKYSIYDHIDERYADASLALDNFADEIITIDPDHQAPMWITSDNAQIVELLEDLFYNRLKLRDGLYLNTITRNMYKYGDGFQEVVVGDVTGVCELKELPVKSMWIKFSIDGKVHGYHQRFMNSAAASYMLDFDPWQIFHLKLPPKTTGGIYGNSLLADAILPQRMLEAVELAAMLSRINGATDRYVYKIPVGNRSRGETEAYMREVIQSVRRKQVVNTQNGQFVSVNDIMTALEDIFLPQRENGSIEIDRLDKRSSVSNSIEDIEYFDKKAKSSLKMPQAFMENEQPLQLKSMSSGDLRFARKVMKGQALIKKFLYYVGDLHLKYTWWNNRSAWDIQLASVNQLEEMAALENLEMRYNLAGTMLEHIPDLEIYTKILKYPEDKAKELIDQLRIQREGRIVEDAVSSAKAEIAAAQLSQDAGVSQEEALTQELRVLMLTNPQLRTAVHSLVEVNKQLLKANKDRFKNTK